MPGRQGRDDAYMGQFTRGGSAANRRRMEIKRDDLTGSEIAELLRDHLTNMAENSPPESMHVLSLEELRQPDITFWSVWNGAKLLACGALKELDPQHGEIKSM